MVYVKILELGLVRAGFWLELWSWHLYQSVLELSFGKGLLVIMGSWSIIISDMLP